MRIKNLAKKIISISFSLIFIFALFIGGILYFGFFEEVSNGIVGMYYVHKGDKAYRKKKLPKAIEYYQKGLNAYPRHYEAWTNLGNIYVVFEDFYSARDAYKNAIEQKSNYTPARMNYGVIATEKLGDFEEAIEQYKNIINAKHKFWTIPFVFNNRKSEKINKGLAYYNMGVAYRLKSFYESDDEKLANIDLRNAIDSYESALKILKNDYNTIFNLALAYQLLGETKSAAKNYCKAISLEPMKYEAHYNLAILLKHLKMYKESYSEIEKASLLAAESGNINSNTQSYVFDILNSMSMTLINQDDYKYLIEKQSYNPQDNEVTYVHGKMVVTEELDKAILNNLKKCEAEEYYKEED